MITQPLAASILTAPIAAIDRRALSQAWYSALHVRARTDATDGERPKPGRPTRAGHSMVWREPPAKAALERAAAAASRVRPASSRAGVAAPERRATRSSLGRNIESAFLKPGTGVRRATFDLGTLHGRVHVTLQSSGTGLRLVAVCKPSACETVARALTQARFALAARGIAFDEMELRAIC